MRDEFAASRLPDLPNDGYSTTREKRLSDEVMFYIRDLERNRPLLLVTVLEGKEKFRRIAKKAWRHLKCDSEMADAVFGYLVLLAGDKPEEQFDTLRQMFEAKRNSVHLWLPPTTT